ncbi:hypothetical protein [Pedobacter ginsengisoli]|uniref:hypothetical protein n=1 Tax=Pedobacter ginsengisoli TaxID=363852 RepID=UPI00255149C6|nr:hypothetical protein [Pedobacter ginsengisoli]
MPQVRNRKLIFELSAREKARKFAGLVSAVVDKAKSMNQPIIYKNDLCIKRNMFIHQYPDGRTELIEQDIDTSVERIIQVLHG